MTMGITHNIFHWLPICKCLFMDEIFKSLSKRKAQLDFEVILVIR